MLQLWEEATQSNNLDLKCTNCLHWISHSAEVRSNKHTKFLHITEKSFGSKQSKDFGQIKPSMSRVLCAYSAQCPRFLSVEKLDKHTNFYWTGGAHAGTKQQVSIFATLSLLEELWEHTWLWRRSYFWPLAAGKYLACILSAHTRVYDVKPYML